MGVYRKKAFGQITPEYVNSWLLSILRNVPCAQHLAKFDAIDV